jgi:hypothetical protein
LLVLAQTYDEQKNYPAALHLYRICVDLLLEELMFTEGTEQSRVYLREKCTAIMDHIDSLKNKLDPIPATTTTTTTDNTNQSNATTAIDNNETAMDAPTEQMKSLDLS